MSRHTLVGILVMGLAVGAAACDDDDSSGPQAETYVATLNGQNERPNRVTSSATGTATVTVNANNTMDVTVNVQNMTGIRLAHIHAPAPVDSAAGVALNLFLLPTGGTPLTITNGPLVTGNFGASALNNTTMDALLANIRAGRAYVNVHTVANPGGEIRGQLVRQ
jgi:hypothetical protein